MSEQIQRLYFSGYCYWSMEAVFTHLKGVRETTAGWISQGESADIEAVRIDFSPKEIVASTLIEIHLAMHSSATKTGIKKRYPTRVFSDKASDTKLLQSLVEDISQKSNRIYYCKSERLSTFHPAKSQYQNYYLNGPEKPFCQQYIRPKLEQLNKRWPKLFAAKI